MTARLRLHLGLASAVLIAAIWLATGTMAPYAATLEYPSVLEPCHYLANVDHEQFAAVFRMLRGDDFETWGWSVVLRRVLFPIVALPLVNAFGFLAGGVVASAIIHLAVVIAFALFVARRIGDGAAIAVLWLLATYPGITYWAGLPYSYVVIVPGSLLCSMLLYRLNEATSIRAVASAALLLGVIFLGYDLLPFFGAAAVLVLVYRRRVMWAALAAVTMLLPSLMVAALFFLIGVPLVNSNTVTYVLIVHAYLHPGDFAVWGRYLAALPGVFVSNFLFSNFVVLPLLFTVAVAVSLRRRLRLLAASDVAVLVASIALFLFNNAAPPYYGWQLRGTWMARLYQPMFPAMLFAVARLTELLAGARWWRGALFASVLANASIAFGPAFLNPVAAHVYQRFYLHSPADALLVNLRRFGRRPLGVCRGDNHTWDHIPNPNTPLNRPAFMYRYPPQ